MSVITYYRTEIRQQYILSRGLERCCHKLVNPNQESLSTSSHDRFRASVDTLSALLKNIADDNRLPAPPEKPWYERKWSNWTLLALGALFLVFYTAVACYDQAWQNSNSSTPLRPTWLLAIVLLSTITLAAHTAISMVKTKISEDRQETVDNQIDEDRLTTARLIASAEALRDYVTDTSPGKEAKKYHLQRFVNNFLKLPNSLFEKDPKLGKILGKLIEQLPEKDPLKVVLKKMVKNSPSLQQRQFLRQSATDKESVDSRTVDFDDELADNSVSEYQKNWYAFLEALDLERLDSIVWDGKECKSPQLPSYVTVPIEDDER